jgi:hypothetical protein
MRRPAGRVPPLAPNTSGGQRPQVALGNEIA